jgi:hypothetical protein
MRPTSMPMNCYKPKRSAMIETWIVCAASGLVSVQQRTTALAGYKMILLGPRFVCIDLVCSIIIRKTAPFL